ncbi:efflux RND transporter periplasmic adaptor subunit [Terrarubrum flagellatum]|uniref:efflux RND transporter periplasmic adaptor subunit n=1 Tax=Terrirubrum flagellatum TaxID=2895980 RepID=UPI0031453DA8
MTSRFFLSVLTCVCALGITRPASAEDKATLPATPPPAVTVVRAVPTELAETVFVSGTLTPRDEALVGPEVDGLRIVELSADEGDRVKAGQTLTRLSRETLDIMLLQNTAALLKIDASIDQAKAQIAQAEADLVWSNATLERSKQLDRSGFASKEVIDQKTASARGAQAKLNAAKEGLSLAEADRQQTLAQRKDTELRIARTDIKSPVDGVVSRRTAKIGAIVSGSQDPLFRIIKDGVVEIEADVSETVLARLKPGQKIEATIAGSDEPIRGQVRLVSPEINRTTRLGRVRLTLDTPRMPSIGSFARATIEIARRTGLAVPQSAVLTTADRTEIQVVVDGMVQTRAVKVGIKSNGMAQIEDGVKEGEDVIAISGTFVRNGDRVTPVARTASAK